MDNTDRSMHSEDNRHTDIIQWATQQLRANAYPLMHAQPTIIRSTPWSYLLRFETQLGFVYVKHMPKLLALEPLIIQILHDRFQASVPSIIAHNATLDCFIMNHAGPTLRERLDTMFDEALFCRAIEQFTSLQIAISADIDVFLDIGVPDYRCNKLSDLYKDFLSNTSLLRSEGLSDREINQLEKNHLKVSGLCKKLSQYSIPESMVQPDFNGNNICVSDIDSTITFVDLGEITIAHPFFSLFNGLEQCQKHHGLSETDRSYLRLQEACFQPYRQFLKSREEFSEMLITARSLYIVYKLLDQYRFMKACGKDNLIAFQHWKMGSLLQTFLSLDLNIESTST